MCLKMSELLLQTEKLNRTLMETVGIIHELKDLDGRVIPVTFHVYMKTYDTVSDHVKNWI